ncbi:MAG: polysaccharide deacetylase family protein [Solirubrobacteraceae bacterium]
MQTLSLTFDDGPDPTSTGAVLDALACCRVRATFFVVGERVRDAPATLRAVLAAGHDVQLHCDRHIRHSELDEGQIEHDVQIACATLAQHGVLPTVWRTPWGVCTAATRSVAARHRLELVRWDLDAEDWRGGEPASMLARLGALEEGGVVLMHDALGPGATRTDCQSTVRLIGELVATARAADLLVGPLSCGAPA